MGMRFAGHFFRSGKVRPLNRGAGLGQQYLLNFHNRLELGEWCHIFPEGVVRPNEIGLFRRGVGKLILNSNIELTVLPFYIEGMQHVQPLRQNQTELFIFPKTGKHVEVYFGNPLDFSDLKAELRLIRSLKGSNSHSDNIVGAYHDGRPTTSSVVLSGSEVPTRIGLASVSGVTAVDDTTVEEVKEFIPQVHVLEDWQKFDTEPELRLYERAANRLSHRVEDLRRELEHFNKTQEYTSIYTDVPDTLPAVEYNAQQANAHDHDESQEETPSSEPSSDQDVGVMYEPVPDHSRDREQSAA
eukprot:GFYU01015399.1.p1 GENE.GFYU01015399.1~~GFYU01015399.1.p1  ORF type:complete len:299 (-),score=33.01 GFYU01015399.1:71-967(-)